MNPLSMTICQKTKHPAFIQPFYLITRTSSSKSTRHNLKTQNKEIIFSLHSVFRCGNNASSRWTAGRASVGRAASYCGVTCVFCWMCFRQTRKTCFFLFFIIFFCAKLSLILVSPHSYIIFVERMAFRTATIFWWFRSVAFLSSFYVNVWFARWTETLKKNPCLCVI